MKRIFLLLLAALLLASSTACGNGITEETAKTDTDNTAQEKAIPKRPITPHRNWICKGTSCTF